jgi:osmoprotectant transport system substrate-binding protein
LLGLEEVYGVKFDRFIALDAGGPLTHQALRNGYVDVALLFTTDPELIGSDLVKLTDDLSLQPAENVTPIVRREVIAGWGPEFEQVVNDVSSRLTTSELRQLNARAAEGIEPSKVAQEWLTSWGYLP